MFAQVGKQVPAPFRPRPADVPSGHSGVEATAGFLRLHDRRNCCRFIPALIRMHAAGGKVISASDFGLTASPEGRNSIPISGLRVLRPKPNVGKRCATREDLLLRTLCAEPRAWPKSEMGDFQLT
jgi:hypothetical protein